MYKFHKAFYAFMRTAIIPYFATFGQFSWHRYYPKSKTYLVLTNHNTNWDFFLFGLVLKPHMYFVASEHIFRQGLTSFIIKTLADPIPRRKGSSSDDTVRMIKERLAKGQNVCMMAEGNRSFTGETGFISPNTAKLVKECGAGLITYRLHGGYFVNPRWSTELRRGPSSGEVVNEYTAEELGKLSVDEVYDIIRRDLYVDAYADQALKPRRYKCAHPAEHLETALYLCPECKSFSTLHSSGDRFFCSHCGMELKFNDYGFFEREGGEPPFRTVLDWDRWELGYMHELLPKMKSSTEPLFSDCGQRISRVTPGVGTELIAEGSLVMFSDRIELQHADGALVFPLERIEKISVRLVDTVNFTADGVYYEIKCSQPYSATKYMIASRLLIGKEYV